MTEVFEFVHFWLMDCIYSCLNLYKKIVHCIMKYLRVIIIFYLDNKARYLNVELNAFNSTLGRRTVVPFFFAVNSTIGYHFFAKTWNTSGYRANIQFSASAIKIFFCTAFEVSQKWYPYVGPPLFQICYFFGLIFINTR